MMAFFLMLKEGFLKMWSLLENAFVALFRKSQNVSSSRPEGDRSF
jgi:hypothetical protein